MGPGSAVGNLCETDPLFAYLKREGAGPRLWGCLPILRFYVYRLLLSYLNFMFFIPTTTWSTVPGSQGPCVSELATEKWVCPTKMVK